MNSEGLKFFNSLGGILHIEIDQKPRQVGLMDFAPEDALIKHIQWAPWTYGEEETEELTSEQLGIVVFEQPMLTLSGEAGQETTHYAPNGKHFTVQDMIQVVTNTEAQTRGKTQWFGGIDLHHIYFEGIHDESKSRCNRWRIYWGS